MAVRPKDDEEGEDESEDEEEGVREEVIRAGVEGERIHAGKNDGNLGETGDPRKPSMEEVERHNRTHVTYRNWCPHCVMAKGRDLDHGKVVKDERGLNEYSFDYGFPGNEFGFKLTVLVDRERSTGMSMATVVPAKGSTGKFTADEVMEFFQWERGVIPGAFVNN